jgi:hypothetical protein
MIEIKCKKDDLGDEILPDYTETKLCVNDFNTTKRQEKMIMLYNAIARMENYWYFNTPTAFGNPEYSMYNGFVKGMICGLGWDFKETDDEIFISTGKTLLMKIQKPKKPDAYLITQKENAELKLNWK